jgi:hypothetical protein
MLKSNAKTMLKLKDSVLSTRKHNWISHLRTEGDPVSETSCFLVFRIPDKVQKRSTLKIMPIRFLLLNKKCYEFVSGKQSAKQPTTILHYPLGTFTGPHSSAGGRGGLPM